MTLSDIVRASVRLWPVTLLGALLTLVVCVGVASRPAVYWGQVNVVILLPQSASLPNAFRATQTNAIFMAGIIEREVGGGRTAQVASNDVTIVGQGITDGSRVRLVNNGGQWVSNFDQPVLNVEAAAATPDEVSRRLDQMVDRIQAALKRRQDMAHVAPGVRFSTTTSPAAVVIREERGRLTAALTVTVLMGLGVTTSSLVLLDMRRRRQLGARVRAVVVGNQAVPRVLVN